jgi:RNA polymerase sigma factor (sigma-70 family)
MNFELEIMNFESKNALLDVYCKEIARYKKLSQEEECAIIERMSKDDMAARKILIESYLGLVVSMANNPKFRHQAELLDLIQEGNIGLIKAVDCFDPATGNSFVAFAMECIKNRMLLFVQNQPEEMLVLDSKVFEDDEEYVCHGDLVVDEANELGSASYEIVEDKMINEEREEHLYAKMERLPSREREVVQLLYGVGVRDAMSLQEVAMMVGLSKERVGQIRDTALRRLSLLK